ncbi:ZIP family metal transporter [Verrucomicrobiota bacterium]
MLTGIQWIYLICIILITFAGGYIPLFRQEEAKRKDGFPSGEAFTAGIFLALSLTLMLPSAFHLLGKALPDVDYPIASIIAILAFVFLLFLEHVAGHIREAMKQRRATACDALAPASIPIIMTVMIAIPSFFLGTVLGVSEKSAAVFIFVAIMAHKSSAAFALALSMVRSTLTRRQTYVTFCVFAFSTPIGILSGAEVHQFLGSHTMLIVKGVILSLASGTFLYMSTLHELEHAPLIRNCGCRKGFLFMLCGFVITALVRLLIGEAHHMHM